MESCLEVIQLNFYNNTIEIGSHLSKRSRFDSFSQLKTASETAVRNYSTARACKARHQGLPFSRLVYLHAVREGQDYAFVREILREKRLVPALQSGNLPHSGRYQGEKPGLATSVKKCLHPWSCTASLTDKYHLEEVLPAVNAEYVSAACPGCKPVNRDSTVPICRCAMPLDRPHDTSHDSQVMAIKPAVLVVL